MTAQHSEIRLYEALSSTWLANARYRNVNTPVDAIPIVRIRAPAAYEPLLGAVCTGSRTAVCSGADISPPAAARSTTAAASATRPALRGAPAAVRDRAAGSGGDGRACYRAPAGTPRGRR